MSTQYESEKVLGSLSQGGSYHTPICPRLEDIKDPREMERWAAKQVWNKEPCPLCIPDDFGHPTECVPDESDHSTTQK